MLFKNYLIDKDVNSHLKRLSNVELMLEINVNLGSV